MAIDLAQDDLQDPSKPDSIYHHTKRAVSLAILVHIFCIKASCNWVETNRDNCKALL